MILSITVKDMESLWMVTSVVEVFLLMMSFVLIAPSSSALRNMLVQVSSWANINEMKFDINKCATMIIRPKNFDSNGSPDPTFYIDNHPLPKTSLLHLS